MKKSKILLATLPFASIAAIIPTIVGCSKKAEATINVGEVEKETTGLIDREYAFEAYAYVTGFKFVSGKFNSLSANVINVSGFKGKITTKIIDNEYENYFMVEIHFESEELIKQYAPTFDVQILSNGVEIAKVTGCTSSFVDNNISINDDKVLDNQTFYTNKLTSTYDFGLNGKLSGWVNIPNMGWSMGEWETFKAQVIFLQPTTVKATAKLVDCGPQGIINLHLENVTEAISNLQFQVRLTNDQVPNWSFTTKTLTLSITQDASKCLEYTLDTEKTAATLTKCNSIDSEITIPDKINVDGVDYSVNSIAKDVFAYDIGLKKITFPETIGELVAGVFYNCRNLDNVFIPKSINKIDSSTFRNCSSLKVFTVDPDNGTFASQFEGKETGCLLSKDLKTAWHVFGTNPIPTCVTTLGDDCFQENRTVQELVVPSNVTYIGKRVFTNCRNLKKITFNEGANFGGAVRDYCFSGCSKLEEITIPEGVQVFNWYAFQNCSALKKIKLPESLVRIETDAFAGCSALPSIEIPKKVQYFSNSSMFGTCTNLKEIKVADGNRYFTSKDKDGNECNCLFFNNNGKYELYRAGIEVKNINFDNLSGIAPLAFNGNKVLEEFEIPASMTTIGASAFQGCSGLKSIKLHEEITDIGQKAFSDCSSLLEITIPSKITKLNNSLLANCTSLNKVTFADGNKLTTIGDEVFAGCSALTGISIPETVTSLGSSPFDECSSLKEVTLPAVETLAYGTFARCYSLEKIDASKAIKLKTLPSAFAKNCIKLKDVILPAKDITEIKSRAFDKCLSLENINIPTTLEKMSLSVFSYCYSLKSIDLSSTKLSEMEDSCFAYCDNLREVKLPSTLTEIPEMTFYSCYKLDTINIPEGVLRIGLYAFYMCGELTSLQMPSTLTMINTDAFAYCDKLSSVKGLKTDTGKWYYIDGSEADVSTETLAASVLKDGYCITWIEDAE